MNTKKELKVIKRPVKNRALRTRPEEKYRLMVENANEAILIIQDGWVKFPNPHAVVLTGFTAAELTKIPWAKFIHPEDRDFVLELHTKRLKGKEVSDNGLFRLITKSNRELWVEENAVAISWENKPAILSFISDITPRKRLEAQLQQAQKMRSLGTLVAGVAHEINNPINLIMLNTPLLKKIWCDLIPLVKKHAVEEPEKRYGGLDHEFLLTNLNQLIEDIDLAANRVAKIITDLKDFTRQPGDDHKKPLLIQTAVQNAVRLAQTTIKKAGITLKVDLAEDLPLMEGNLQSIEHIILNILINAIQAIQHDHGLIKIKTGQMPEDGRIFVAVSDNGRGIDPALQDTIFDPFVTDRQPEGGTGLGLSITYNLVKEHDGEIGFKSRKGKGTTFTVLFPVLTRTKTVKVLVADDDPVFRKNLVQALAEYENFRVEEAVNGTETCIKLGTYRPDLLILDIFMPEMDGLEVCRTIIHEPKLADTRVMVITGFPGNPQLKKVAELGFKDIYYKPIKLAGFHEAVAKQLRRLRKSPVPAETRPAATGRV